MPPIERLEENRPPKPTCKKHGKIRGGRALQRLVEEQKKKREEERNLKLAGSGDMGNDCITDRIPSPSGDHISSSEGILHPRAQQSLTEISGNCADLNKNSVIAVASTTSINTKTYISSNCNDIDVVTSKPEVEHHIDVQTTPTNKSRCRSASSPKTVLTSQSPAKVLSRSASRTREPATITRSSRTPTCSPTKTIVHTPRTPTRSCPRHTNSTSPRSSSEPSPNRKSATKNTKRPLNKRSKSTGMTKSTQNLQIKPLVNTYHEILERPHIRPRKGLPKEMDSQAISDILTWKESTSPSTQLKGHSVIKSNSKVSSPSSHNPISISSQTDPYSSKSTIPSPGGLDRNPVSFDIIFDQPKSPHRRKSGQYPRSSPENLRLQSSPNNVGRQPRNDLFATTTDIGTSPPLGGTPRNSSHSPSRIRSSVRHGIQCIPAVKKPDENLEILGTRFPVHESTENEFHRMEEQSRVQQDKVLSNLNNIDDNEGIYVDLDRSISPDVYQLPPTTPPPPKTPPPPSNIPLMNSREKRPERKTVTEASKPLVSSVFTSIQPVKASQKPVAMFVPLDEGKGPDAPFPKEKPYDRKEVLAFMKRKRLERRSKERLSESKSLTRVNSDVAEEIGATNPPKATIFTDFPLGETVQKKRAPSRRNSQDFKEAFLASTANLQTLTAVMQSAVPPELEHLAQLITNFDKGVTDQLQRCGFNRYSLIEAMKFYSKENLSLDQRLSQALKQFESLLIKLGLRECRLQEESATTEWNLANSVDLATTSGNEKAMSVIS